jgi:hypothetical protein
MRMAYCAAVAVFVVAIAASPSARADTTDGYTFAGAGVLAGDDFTIFTAGPAMIGPDYLLTPPIPMVFAGESFTTAISVDFVFDPFYPGDALFFNCATEDGCVISPVPFLGLTDLSVPGTYVLTSGNAFGSSLAITTPEPGVLALLAIGLLPLMPGMRKRYCVKPAR